MAEMCPHCGNPMWPGYETAPVCVEEDCRSMTPTTPIECPACDFPFEVKADGKDLDLPCPDCGVQLTGWYDAEMDERGTWRGGYNVRVAK